jgi:hypothetical protein
MLKANRPPAVSEEIQKAATKILKEEFLTRFALNRPNQCLDMLIYEDWIWSLVLYLAGRNLRGRRRKERKVSELLLYQELLRAVAARLHTLKMRTVKFETLTVVRSVRQEPASSSPFRSSGRLAVASFEALTVVRSIRQEPASSSPSTITDAISI